MPAPVLVVGAGPVGLVVAALLARHGVASTVVDRRVGPFPGPRAVHLDGECARILQAVGVHGGFAALSRPGAGLRLLDARLRPFAEFRRGPGPHGHPEANLFHQPDLEALLRAHLGPLVTLREGAEVVSVEQGGVTLAGGERLPAAVVLGCDGAGSTVRAAIGTRLRDLRFAERWLVVDVRCARPLGGWGGVDQVCSPHRAATFLHVTDDRYRWEFRLHPGERADAVPLGELLAPWSVGEWEVVRRAEYVFRAAVADRWRRGRTFLVGDAAHLTPPFVGQGLGAGLRDAHDLAWKLAAVLRGAAPDALLDTYQRERAPHAEATIRVAIRAGRAMTGGQGVAAALRRPVAAALLRLPGAEGLALRGTAVRHPPGPFVDRRRHRRDLAGTLCPQPWVRVDGAPRRLDDVLGAGFALLVAGPVEPALARRARALGAVAVRLPGAAPDLRAVTVADDGTLAAWLRRGRATAVLLRPDRVVVASSPARRVKIG